MKCLKNKLLILIIILVVIIGIQVTRVKNMSSEVDKLQTELNTLREENNDLQAMKELEVKPVSSVKVHATAYCPCSLCCGKNDRVAASGARVKEGRTIASPLPFGTKIYIPYLDEVRTVEDRGGAIKGNEVDIYFDSHEEALEFGKRELKIYILE